MEIIEYNKKIQTAFYIFIIKIISNFMKAEGFDEDDNIDDNESFSESRMPSFVVDKEKEKNNQMEEEEQQLKEKRQLSIKAGGIFKEKFIKSSKYNSFFINYIKYHNSIDVYKIPYNFINEFVYYYQCNGISLMELDIIGITEQFYGKKKLLDFEEIINKKKSEIKLDNQKIKDKKRQIKGKKEILEENIIKEIEKIKHSNLEEENLQNVFLFSFNNFFEYYQKNLRAIINREQEDDKENFSKVKSNNGFYKKYQRKNYFLSQKILNIYITFINNNLKELSKTFELIKCNYKNEEKDKFNNSEESSSIIINNDFQKKLYLKENSKNKLVDLEEVKNEKEELLFLFQNKLKMNKSLKEKFFGTYDILEIDDIIEDNLIFQRYYSNYELIKYSLLNILAITRTVDSKIINNQNIMQIVFDFCEVTKLHTKKYMNIYLYIFQKIYQNENLLEKLKIKECIKMVSLYFTKKNMIPSEKNDEFLNEIKMKIIEDDYDLLISNSISESDDFKEYIKKYGNFFQIIKGIFFSNKKEFVNALPIIETLYLGHYENNAFNFYYNELNELFNEIELNDNNKKFIPKTPILLYESSNKKLKKYLKDFPKENIQNNELYHDILSLLFYFKIPIIEDKWIGKSKLKENKNGNLNELLKKIIAILFDLFNILKIKK